MSSKSKEFKQISNQTKQIVSGYIRQEHKSQFKSSHYALFQNVPISITSFCTLYYNPKEFFQNISACLISSNNNETITQSSRFIKLNTNYGSIDIPSNSKCIYKWYLKIGNKSSQGGCYVGIASQPFVTKEFMAYIPNQKFYAYSTLTRDLLSHVTYSRCRESVQYGGIVCIELNLKEKTMKVYVGGTLQNDNVAWIVETGDDINYRLAVSLTRGNAQVSIVKFEQMY